MNSVRFGPSFAGRTNIPANPRFGGTPEILYNLGKALNAAQYFCSCGDSKDLCLVEEKGRDYGQVIAYIDAATRDREFPAFMENYHDHLCTPTNSRPGGSRRNFTLPQIANLTKYFGENHLSVRAEGFKKFKQTLLEGISWEVLRDNPQIKSQLPAFLKAIEPSLFADGE